MQKSTYISAGGHVVLLGYALFGGLFSAEPLELPTVDVSVVSEAEFAALTQASQPPDVTEDTPTPLALTPTEPDVDPVIAPAPQTNPEPPAQTPSIAMPAPLETAPAPQPSPEPVPQPAPQEEVVVIPDLAPDTSQRPKPRPAPRVAPEAVAAPEPNVEIDNTAQEATQPSENADQPVEEQTETAPEAASTEIVTEAEQPAASAPSASLRPRPRPRTEAAASTSEASPTSGVNAALAEALGEPAAQDAPTGPPLSAGETDALRLAVQNCWVVDVGSQAANVTVVVGMDMDLRGKVIPGSLRLVSSSGGEGAAANIAFQSARRAIFRCQKDGYALPEDKYEQWKQIEMTFNPKDMRIR